MNPGYALLLGKHEVVGQPLNEFFSGGDMDSLMEVIREVAETSKPVTTRPMHVRAAEYGGHPDDQFIHSIVPIYNVDGTRPATVVHLY